MTVTNFSCDCGNADTKKVIEYTGILGYEAIVCRQCGSYSDHSGIQEADDWSLALVELKTLDTILERIDIKKR